ncbi:MAG: IPT/TIG domain-containing protein, partial [Proteobacteria bacterium]|nr:IPT/TIG domain-containing protein [Pseudomonadota bacterium]
MKRMLAGLVLVSGVAGAAIFNWSGFAPLATDPAGDTTSGESAIDLRYLYATLSGSNLYFRVDVSGNLGTVLPPTVTAVTPSAGPLAGGTSVTITGANLAGITAVKFGATNAASFTVNSATQVTATAPAGSAGTVDVTVTTAGGTSATSAADQY